MKRFAAKDGKKMGKRRDWLSLWLRHTALIPASDSNIVGFAAQKKKSGTRGILTDRNCIGFRKA